MIFAFGVAPVFGVEMDRKTAIRLKFPRYSTGKPCLRGHFSERFSASGNCCECSGAFSGLIFRGPPADLEALRAVWGSIQASRGHAPDEGVSPAPSRPSRRIRTE
jgi:hypothetical protein